MVKRIFVRFVVIFAVLGFLGACSKNANPNNPTPQPGAEPLWSTVVKSNLTVAPNPATTRSALMFSGVTIQVRQVGIATRDKYTLTYPDGRKETCVEKSDTLQFINTKDLSGSCELLKTTDPVGMYTVSLEHQEIANGLVKDFPVITASFPVNKG